MSFIKDAWQEFRLRSPLQRIEAVAAVITILGVVSWRITPRVSEQASLRDGALASAFYAVCFALATVFITPLYVRARTSYSARHWRTFALAVTSIVIVLSAAVAIFSPFKQIYADTFQIQAWRPPPANKVVIGLRGVISPKKLRTPDSVEVVGEVEFRDPTRAQDYVVAYYLRKPGQPRYWLYRGNTGETTYVNRDGTFNMVGIPLANESEPDNAYLVVMRRRDWRVTNIPNDKTGFPDGLAAFPSERLNEIGAAAYPFWDVIDRASLPN